MKPKSPTRQTKPQGNYVDAFVKNMFGRVLVFTDFLRNYADPKFVAAIDLGKITPAPTHYIGHKGDERIVDLVFHCPLKSGNGSLMAVIVFEHQSSDSLKKIPQKLIKYISAIWESEAKEGKPLSAPYFLVLRTGKKPHRKRYATMADSLPKYGDGEPVGKKVEVEFDVVDLPSWDFDKLVGGAVLRSALMMLHTTTGGHLDDFPKALLPLLELPEGERVEVTKELLDFAAKAFAANSRKLDAAAVGAAVETIFKGKGQKMMKTIFEEQQDIGEARGVVKGEAKMVVNALRTRFGKVPKGIEKAIFAMSDSIALESMLVQAIQSDTLEEFADGLG